MAFVVNSFPFGSLLTSAKMTAMQDNDNQIITYFQHGNIASIIVAAPMTENTDLESMPVPVYVNSIYYGEWLEVDRQENHSGASISVNFLGVSVPTGVSSVQVNSCGWVDCTLDVNCGAGDTFKSLRVGIACSSGFTI